MTQQVSMKQSFKLLSVAPLRTQLNKGFNFDQVSGKITGFKVIDTGSLTSQHEIQILADGSFYVLPSVVNDTTSNTISLELLSDCFVLNPTTKRLQGLRVIDTATQTFPYLISFEEDGSFYVQPDPAPLTAQPLLTQAFLNDAFFMDSVTNRITNLRVSDTATGYLKYLISINLDGSFTTPLSQDNSSTSTGDVFTATSLVIDVSRLEQNLLARARSRMLYQFKNSVILDEFVQAITAEVQALYDAAVGVVTGRTIALAVGAQLDIIGALVGQKRLLDNASLKLWFTPDLLPNNLDQAPMWVAGAPLSGDLLMTDDQYRLVILARIFRNEVQGASVPELRRYIFLLTGIKASFAVSGPLEVSLVFPVGTPLNLIRMLMTDYSDTRVENTYLIPFAVCTRLNTSLYYSAVVDEDGDGISFMPDNQAGRPDNGRFAVMAALA